MRIQEIDQQLAESLGEGPMDWAKWKVASSGVGQWWNSQAGKKQQYKNAIDLVQKLAKWRGFTGIKETTPEALLKWLVDGENNSGLQLDQATAKDLLLKNAKAAFGPGVKTKTPLDNNQVKNFITAISRDARVFDASTGDSLGGEKPDLKVVPGSVAGAEAGSAAAG